MQLPVPRIRNSWSLSPRGFLCLEPGFPPSLYKVYIRVFEHLLTVQLLCNYLEPLPSKECHSL